MSKYLANEREIQKYINSLEYTGNYYPGSILYFSDGVAGLFNNENYQRLFSFISLHQSRKLLVELPLGQLWRYDPHHAQLTCSESESSEPARVYDVATQGLNIPLSLIVEQVRLNDKDVWVLMFPSEV